MYLDKSEKILGPFFISANSRKESTINPAGIFFDKLLIIFPIYSEYLLSPNLSSKN